jgi:putative glutamine amidotransferase
VVEAVEVPRAPFTVGVQWHAESMTESAPHARLFRAFVESASSPRWRRDAPAAVA